MAVVKELQQGNDKFVQSATIQTANGITNRPITKLYPLQVNAGMDVSTRGQSTVDNNNHSKDVRTTNTCC